MLWPKAEVRPIRFHDLTGQEPDDANKPKTPVPSPAKLAQGVESLREVLKKAEWNATHSFADNRLLPKLEAQLKGTNVPLEFALGMIDQESSGKIKLQMNNEKDEVGLFQISTEERRLLASKKHRESEIRKEILDSASGGIKWGAALLQKYEKILTEGRADGKVSIPGIPSEISIISDVILDGSIFTKPFLPGM